VKQNGHVDPAASPGKARYGQVEMTIWIGRFPATVLDREGECVSGGCAGDDLNRAIYLTVIVDGDALWCTYLDSGLDGPVDFGGIVGEAKEMAEELDKSRWR